MSYAQFFEQFTALFDRAPIVRLARQTRWMIRQGTIDAFEFVAGLVFGQMSALHLTLNAQASSYTEPVTRQAVDQRYHERTVDFFRATFDHCLSQSVAQSPDPSLTQSLAAHFAAVDLVDSTSFDCPESLAQILPGCGGAASAANAKVLLRYEYLRGQFAPLALVPGKRSDQGLAAELTTWVRPNALLIADKAFVKLGLLQQIDQAQGYFLMPWPRALSLWQSTPEGGRKALDLASELRHRDQALVEFPQVFLGPGDPAWAVRLIAFRLSPESAARHRAALREAQRKQGRTPTQEALELAGWLILLTNVPAEKLPARAVSYLYRVRWQIELVFKQCKSVLRLDVTEAQNKAPRVLCEIWARLIAALAIFACHAHVQSACWAQRRREISFAQVARQIQQSGLLLAQALIEGGPRLRQQLYNLWRCLLRTTIKGRQRTRKTTWENLVEHWFGLALH
jgi:hypothetical protein